MKTIPKPSYNKYTEGFNSKNFKDLFLDDNEPFTIENSDVIPYSYVFDASNYKAKGVKFINCQFTGNITFQNIDINYGVTFEKCSFKSIIFYNVNAKAKSQDFSLNKAISFNDCEILNELKLENCNLKNSFEIVNSKIEKLIFSSNKISGGACILSDSSFTCIEVFTENKVAEEVELKKLEIKSEFRIANVQCEFLKIEECEFKADFWLTNSVAKGGVTLFKGSFDDNCKMEAIGSNGILTMKHVDFKKSCELNYTANTKKQYFYAGPQKIHLEACSFGTGLFVCGADDAAVRTNESLKLENVTIIASEKLSGEINFAELKIRELEIRGSNYKSNIILDSIKLSHLSFHYFNNFSTLQLLNITSDFEDSEFTITHCNLGNAQFYNCFLKNFKKVSISNSILSKIETSGVAWFDLNKLLKSDNSGVRETFRQLKYAMQQQGNTIQAMNFKKFEMKAYKKELSKQDSYKVLPDKFILFVNSTNDFGQNWIKPLIILGVFNFIFTVLLICSIKNLFSLDLNLNSDGISYYMSQLKDFGTIYWPLLNPTILLDKIFTKGETLSGLTLMIFFLSRIVLAFFIYQIITAFRKYSK